MTGWWDNPIDRYVIRDRTAGIRYGEDGSRTIRLSHERPDGEMAANRLPAPKGPFYTVIRAYNAGPEVLNGAWSPPPIRRLG